MEENKMINTLLLCHDPSLDRDIVRPRPQPVYQRWYDRLMAQQGFVEKQALLNQWEQAKKDLDATYAELEKVKGGQDFFSREWQSLNNMLETDHPGRNCAEIRQDMKDIEETQGHAVNYPMIGDSDLAVAKLYNMLPADEPGTSEGRTAATNATVRSVFVIGPDKTIKMMLTYPMTTGRNFDEILRALDSMQLTAKHKVATPVNLSLIHI